MVCLVDCVHAHSFVVSCGCLGVCLCVDVLVFGCVCVRLRAYLIVCLCVRVFVWSFVCSGG